MNRNLIIVAIVGVSITAFTPAWSAPLNIPSDGSDGPLIVTASTNINLALAVTGSWTNNNTANVGKGVYDPSKWAVVFKYSSVFIASGATVTFSNHSTRAPVVWLVNGDVAINGALNLNGSPITADIF